MIYFGNSFAIHRQRKEVSIGPQRMFLYGDMEKNEIRESALKMKNIKDLRLLLNKVKRDALGDKSHPFHLKQITYYCNPKRENVVRYTNFSIPKKSGGERIISAPVAGLKSILYSLNTILQSIYEPSKYAMGFVAGRSVVDNARAHLGQNYVYNIDLQDFFPSIDKSRIWKRLTLPPFSFASELADVIAGLCTMRIEDGENIRYVLPQGAPTSPILTNIICEKLDRKLGGLAKRFGLHYTRYADDITFSSMHYVYSADGEFIGELGRIIADNNFAINDKKTRLQKLGQCQEVTGLILSDKVNVTKRYTKELRTMLHIWERYGFIALRESYMRHRCSSPKHRQRCNEPSIEAIIVGKLQYLKMVKGESDSVYTKLLARFNALTIGGSNVTKYGKYNKMSYLRTMTREEFEKAVAAKVCYNPESKNKAYFTVGRVETPISISRTVDVAQLFDSANDIDKLWKNIQISLCDNGETQFYMLHKRLVAPQYTTEHNKIVSALQGYLTQLVNSDTFNSVLNDDSQFATFGEEVVLEDIEDIILDDDDAKALAEFADTLDADISVVKKL